jgi:hypothetical protein
MLLPSASVEVGVDDVVVGSGSGAWGWPALRAPASDAGADSGCH